jgi:hypothetical protein
MTNGSGVDYPTIELGGKTYTVKFSRGLLYRMSKLGVVFAPQVVPNPNDPSKKLIQMSFVQIVDVLHVAIGFEGTHEELAELVFEHRPQVIDALMAAWGKAFPPAPLPQVPAEPKQVAQ